MAKKAGRQNQRRSGQRRSRSRTATPRRRSGPRPLPKGDSFATPDPSPVRDVIERRSATLLVYLHRLPRWVPLFVMLGLLTCALVVKGVVGAVLLVAMTAILGWLAYIAWPTLRGTDRAFRVASVVVVLAGAGYFAFAT